MPAPAIRHLAGAALFALPLAFAQPAAAEIHVLSSGGFTAAYKDLVAGCEVKLGEKVVSAYGASMGAAPDAIPNRLARGEPADVVILAADAFEKLVEDGKGAAGTGSTSPARRSGSRSRPGRPSRISRRSRR